MILLFSFVLSIFSYPYLVLNFIFFISTFHCFNFSFSVPTSFFNFHLLLPHFSNSDYQFHTLFFFHFFFIFYFYLFNFSLTLLPGLIPTYTHHRPWCLAKPCGHRTIESKQYLTVKTLQDSMEINVNYGKKTGWKKHHFKVKPLLPSCSCVVFLPSLTTFTHLI